MPFFELPLASAGRGPVAAGGYSYDSGCRGLDYGFEQQAGQQKMREVISGKCSFQPVGCATEGVKSSAGVIDQNVQDGTTLLDGSSQGPNLALRRKIGSKEFNRRASGNQAKSFGDTVPDNLISSHQNQLSAQPGKLGCGRLSDP
jgi:hypothetical protein